MSLFFAYNNSILYYLFYLCYVNFFRNKSWYEIETAIEAAHFSRRSSSCS